MRKLLIVLLLTFSFGAFAQKQTETLEKIDKNSVYAELLGNGGLYSINYDRIFQLSKGIKIVPRMGFATFEDVLVFH